MQDRHDSTSLFSNSSVSSFHIKCSSSQRNDYLARYHTCFSQYLLVWCLRRCNLPGELRTGDKLLLRNDPWPLL